MNIGHDSQTPLFTKCPERPEVSPVKADYTCIKAVRIKVIVQDEIANTGTFTVAVPKEKSSAFPGLAVTMLT